MQRKRKRIQKSKGKKIKKIKTETEAWKYINKKRKKKTSISKQITVEKWEQHFMRLLHGKGEEKTKSEQKTWEEEDPKEDIILKEMERQIRKLKKKKAAGENKIKNEARIYSTKNVKLKLLEIIQRIWKREGLPKSWRRGIIIPTYKKEDKDNTVKYKLLRNHTFEHCIQNICNDLRRKIKERSRKKRILPEAQAGFRSGREIMDNIYNLNYAIEKEIQKKGGKVFAFFADLKAAFDIINQKKLWSMMKEKEINKHLLLEELLQGLKINLQVWKLMLP